jgi:hypothetical protein
LQEEIFISTNFVFQVLTAQHVPFWVLTPRKTDVAEGDVTSVFRVED